MRIFLVWVTRLVIAALVSVLLLLGICVASPAAAAWVVGMGPAMLGRTDLCARADALSGLARHTPNLRVAARLRAASRLIGRDRELELWETPQGRFWVPANTAVVVPVLEAQQALRIYGEIRRGDTVLDCGAHIGLYTRQALAMGAALVVAIEPAPENIECLRRNFAAEIRAGRVIVEAKGVWNKVDTLMLHRAAVNSAGDSFVLNDGPGDSVAAPLTTIDLLVEELRLRSVDFIKMDIKGAERQALAGGRKTLERFHPRLAIASEHLPGDSMEIVRLVRAAWADYRPMCYCCYLKDFVIRPEVLRFE